jgi:D-sedoheptulose 7-phosphate isomerase
MNSPAERNPLQQVQHRLRESAELKLQLGPTELVPFLGLVEAARRSLREGRKLLVFGNGGSAADSQHIAAELVGRYRRERRGMPAIALTTDTSILTSVGNDYGFERIFERQIESLAVPGDVVLGISTSGESANVKKGLQCAREIGGIAIGAFLGKTGGSIRDVVDFAVVIPSHDTARIQECHITLGHILCELIEADISEGSP